MGTWVGRVRAVSRKLSNELIGTATGLQRSGFGSMVTTVEHGLEIAVCWRGSSGVGSGRECVACELSVTGASGAVIDISVTRSSAN